MKSWLLLFFTGIVGLIQAQQAELNTYLNWFNRSSAQEIEQTLSASDYRENTTPEDFKNNVKRFSIPKSSSGTEYECAYVFDDTAVEWLHFDVYTHTEQKSIVATLRSKGFKSSDVVVKGSFITTYFSNPEFIVEQGYQAISNPLGKGDIPYYNYIIYRKRGKYDELNGEKTTTSFYDGKQYIASREQRVDGLREGERLTYYPNGGIQSKEQYKSGRLSGLASYFDEAGYLRRTQTFSYNWRYGQEKFYDTLGKVIRTTNWRKDLREGSDKMTLGTKTVLLTNYIADKKQGKGLVPVYDYRLNKNEIIGIEQVQFKDDLKEGLAIGLSLDENDTLYRHYYKAGKLDSIANFYENGILAESVVYQNGFKNGKAIKYVRSGLNKGDIAEELFYKNDALDSIQHQYYACQNCYTANETWHKEERLITYSNRFLQGKYFLISETKEERGFYYNNQKTGQWVERAFVNGHWNTASGTYLNDRKTLVWTETIGDSLRIESFYEDGMLSGKRKTLLNNRLILEEEFASKEITEVIEYASDNSERRFILEGIEKDFVYLRYHSKKDSVISWYNCAIPLKDTLLSGNPYEPLLTKFRKNIHNESTLTPYFVNGFSIETTDYVMGGLFQNGNKDIHQIYYKQADLFEKNNPENGFWDQTYFNQNQQGPFTGQFYSAYYNEFISIKEGYRHDWTIIYNAEGKQIAKAKYVKGELKKRVEIVD
jgi:antitoxin component YwqK of YwqJK toxin-antitoxin module